MSVDFSIDSIKAALGGVRHPITSSLSLPPACYHDERWLAEEMDHLFSKSWFCIGRADQWQNPGDYQALNIGKIPVVIIRDKQGELRAMSNTCLHRSSEIMSGKGNCKAMVCPFHGWSYDANGQVISAPRMETAVNFSEKDFKLKQFTVGIQDGFVFLNLQDDPPTLQDWLGDFSDLHSGWAFDDLVTGRQRSFEVECNWKLFIEVFNEYYHLPYVHPKSIARLYPEPDPVDPVIGEYISQFGRTTGNPALLEDQQGTSAMLPVIKTLNNVERNGTRYTWVFPNMTFAASVDCIWMYHVFPISGNRTRAIQTICFPASSTRLDNFDAIAEDYYNRFDLAIAEDIPALEKQQTGIESPYAAQGRFSTLEPNVANFACWYAEAMVKD